MCSCHLLLLHVCGAHNSKFDINIAYSVGVACVSVWLYKLVQVGEWMDWKLNHRLSMYRSQIDLDEIDLRSI